MARIYVMARYPRTVDGALKVMESKIRYLAYGFSIDYPPIRGDLEQAGRIATAKAFGRYKPGGRASFETYCRKAIINAMINEQKKQMKGFEYGMVEAPDEDFIEQNATEENVVVGGERYEVDKKMREVGEVLGRLPPQEQRVIVAESQGLSTAEIAEQLKLSTRQAQRVRNSAITKLREILAPKSGRRTQGAEKPQK